jgi:hypothetical protein
MIVARIGHPAQTGIVQKQSEVDPSPVAIAA